MSKTKVLITAAMPQDEIDKFKKENPSFELHYHPGADPHTVHDLIQFNNFDAIVVVGNDPFTIEKRGDVLDAWQLMPHRNKRAIIRLGSQPGFDVAKAAEYGIAVMTTPGVSHKDVLDYTFKRIPNPAGKKAAIIGSGAIAKKLIENLKKQGCTNISAWSPHFTPMKAKKIDVEYTATAKDACRNADILLIATHYFPAEEIEKINGLAMNRFGQPSITTRSEDLIGIDAIRKLNDNATIVNLSLHNLVNKGALRGAATGNKVGKYYFNTTQKGIDELKKEFSNGYAKTHEKKGALDLATFNDETRRNLAKATFRRLKDFFEKDIAIDPLFNSSLFAGGASEIERSTEEPQHPDKQQVVFIGAGIDSLVSVMEFVKQTKENKTYDKYEIHVIEKEGAPARGTTHNNGGNFTSIEGLTGLKLGSSSLTKPHKSISRDNSSDGWLIIHPDNMPKQQKDWVVTAHKLSRNDQQSVYDGAAKTITNLGKHSTSLARKFFESNPELRRQGNFQYMDGKNGWLVRIHDSSERCEKNHYYFSTVLGTNVKKLSYEEMLNDQPHLTEASNFRETMQTVGGVGMEGGSINARAFTKALATKLEGNGVKFHYHAKTQEILLDEAKTKVCGIKVTNLNGERVLKADTLICSSGCDVSYFNSIGVNVPVQPVAGCTITVPIPGSIKNYPEKTFKMVTDDGVIVFSPHKEEHNRPTELRVGGMYWFDPEMNVKINSPQAKYGIESLKGYLRKVYPELHEYASTLRPYQLQETVCFRPYTPDNIPIIGKVPNINGIYINMGHGPGGTSYSFASAEILASQVLGKEVNIPGIKAEYFALDRFRDYERYKAANENMQQPQAQMYAKL
jgi:glycine/D-amino acid oxidase-like deaminating enzyme/lactate dehydrogenase-like 2-hydroxyacid dehydrogenase